MSFDLKPEELAALEASPKCVRCGHREVFHPWSDDVDDCSICGWQVCRDFLRKWEPLDFDAAWEDAHRKPSGLAAIYTQTLTDMLTNPYSTPGTTIKFTKFGSA